MTAAGALLDQARCLGLTPDPGRDLETGPAQARAAREAAAVWRAASAEGRNDLAEQALDALRRMLADPAVDRTELSDHVLLVPGADKLPWDRVIPPAHGLALLYNFSPFQDTGSTVASKRLRQFGDSVDVIACSFLHHKKMDPTIERISAPYVRSKHFLPFSPAWATWGPHAAFALRAAALAERYMADRAEPYEFLYTRAMWSPSLLAGALVKLQHPGVRWVAEFSDPLSQDVEGRHRGGPIADDECSRTLTEAFEARYGPLDDRERTVFALPESLVFAFADEIIFTNALQRETMLAAIGREDLRSRVMAVSTVSHHPVLPRPFYRMCEASPQVGPEHLNVAYFGEFYSSRGLLEVTSALRTLPERIRERVRLHVHTNYVAADHGGRRLSSFSAASYANLVERALRGVGAEGVEHLVRFHPSLPFLEFLAATDAFDLLVVRDAASGAHHAVNPYLPSKWSDYSGSTAATWAIVEEGSTMSGLSPRHRSAVHDVAGAREVLWRAVEEKFGDAVASDPEGGPR